MRFRHPRPRVLALTAAAALAVSAWAGTAASAAPSGRAAGPGLTPIPSRVYAPYFEAYLPTSISKIARQVGRALSHPRVHPDAEEGVVHGHLER